MNCAASVGLLVRGLDGALVVTGHVQPHTVCMRRPMLAPILLHATRIVMFERVACEQMRWQ